MKTTFWRILIIAGLAGLAAALSLAGRPAAAQGEPTGIPLAPPAQENEPAPDSQTEPIVKDSTSTSSPSSLEWVPLEGPIVALPAAEHLPLPALPRAAILSDGQFVHGPNVGDFDVRNYIASVAPHLNVHAQTLYGRAHRFSINPRVLLALMEVRTGVVTNTAADIENMIAHMQATVRAQTGIELVREVKIVGEAV